MFKFAKLLLLLPFMVVPAAAQDYDRSQMPTKAEVLADIELLRSNPAGSAAKAAADRIMVFGHLSDDVFVSLKARYTPWVRGNLPELIEDKLIAAFVGGNIEYQLNHSVTEDRPYEGTLTMLKAYESMRAADSCPEIRRLELYRQWLSEGSLKTRLN